MAQSKKTFRPGIEKKIPRRKVHMLNLSYDPSVSVPAGLRAESDILLIDAMKFGIKEHKLQHA
ncbi:hypothetical protein B2K_15525 [Paenibacillus mucilaginosus K02]|uniref:Uncharacterized protein n=1 Tax=Paenibacillus mucilaginosus K02 TaxID=997761 RepID=I0BIB8_9BACL|nr:hypothetical protein B2K_15525 [Paenibacillus mucilaginosus K02]